MNEFVVTQKQQQQTNVISTSAKVHLMDMKGITEANKDISHTIACEVLNIPTCVDGWLVLPDNDAQQNHDKTIVIQQNQKSGNPGLSSQQLDDMEFLLRLRDCTYQQSLQQRSENYFVIHDGSSDHDGSNKFWDDCIMMPTSSSSSSSVALWNESSTDDLLELLKDQVHCGSGRLSTDMIHQRRKQQPQSLLSTTTFVERKLLRPNNNNNNNNKNPIIISSTTSARHDTLYQTARIQAALLVMLTVALFTYIIPKTIWWKKSIMRSMTSPRNSSHH